jgi:ABC-2 type transport system ATP-binding protein
MTSAIHSTGLLKTYSGRRVLDNVSFDVPEGSIFALIGPNGAGKTTTIQILSGLLRADAGACEVLGADSRHLSPADFAHIGYVSENQEMPDSMTVSAFLDFLAPFYPTWDAALATELIRKFDLPLDRKLRHLSRGQRVKAALASSLAYRPRLIILDEPFTGLDVLVRDELIESLLERAADSTIFISSHDLAEIESFASHVAYLDNGQLQFAEELESLTSRFREVTLTFDDAPRSLPQPWPAAWLPPESTGAVLRFIDTRFHPERIQTVFPQARDVAVSALPLRAIFVALAKSAKQRN